MNRLNELDIPKLTKDAESGNGCAIREAIGHLFYEERLAAMTKIDKQNKHNHLDDPAIVELKLINKVANGAVPQYAQIQINRQEILSINPILYSEVMDEKTRTHTTVCSNVDTKTWAVREVGPKR